MNQEVCSWKGATALLCAVLMFFVPIYVNAQIPAQPPEENPCVDAEMAVESHVSGSTWMLVGCALGWVGWVIAMVVEPSPPATLLVGKSPQYVSQFTDCYKSKGKKIQQSKALTGCIIGTVLEVGLYVLFVFVLFAAEEEAISGY